MGLGLVALESFFHQAVNRLLVFPALHVDEIADDEAADVSQAKLPRDLIRGFEVRLQDRFLDVAPAFVPAGVHVDGDQRFGFVDHNVTAAFQPHLAMERVIDLFLDPERLEDRRRPVVNLDPVPGPA